MATYRKILNLAKRNKIFLYSKSHKPYSTNVKVKQESSKSDEIVIPYRIHRGPTDILKALASTVSKDYTAPQYKYEDDPYFIPSSSVTKRAFALSKESGKRAARYFLEKYPEFFLCNKSVPHIKAFNPPTVYTEENVTSPDVLLECLNNIDINNSITVYKILKEKGFVVSQELKQHLLELLCFYNGSQPPEEDYYEERYFLRTDQISERWNRKGEAERLFDEMEKDSKAYSALIAGAGKFQDAERAFELYDEMKNKDLTPTVVAFNSLIASVPSVKENREICFEYTMLLLSTMQKEGLVPDLYTMNAVLNNLYKRRLRKSRDIALNVLAEMKRLNIEPSLGTYSTILNIFVDEYSKTMEIGVLYEIISKIEGKELTIRHPSDVIFFVNAMEKCYKYAQDKDLAYRINNIVEFRNNCKLLGNNLSENVYFKYFLKILCEFENVDKFMEIYEQYVPNTYTPEPTLMLDVLRNVQMMGSYQYLPKLSNDVYVFEQTERENILSVILEMAGGMKHPKELQQKLVDVIWKIVQRLNMRIESKRQSFNWIGVDLAYVLNVFVYGKDLEKSWSILEQFAKPETTVIGPPSKESLLNFCELFLESKQYDKVKFCVKYASKEAYPEFLNDFKKLTDTMFENELLEEKQRVHVDAIVQSFSYDEPYEVSRKTTHDASSSDSSSDEDSSSDSSSSDEEDTK